MNIREKLIEYFSLSKDKHENKEIIDNITSGAQFKGTSLWILICAILIASLGLNMNSTAVIIGAMLISPLMGPIMGIGLGVGIGDNDLIRRCVSNLFVATLFSLLASALYFWISPINDARSELLARTQPTIYDVMIAFFGGFAGIIATGSKSKGNILPGVAIATALMPPLCTAGYGLATFQWKFFYGALYLFLINAVYIGLATWLGTIVLRLPRTVVEEGEESVKSRRKHLAWTGIILFVIIIPSIVTTMRIVHDNVRESRVSAFVHNEFDNLEGIHLISFNYDSNDTIPFIQVNLLGAPLDNHAIDVLAARMGTYGLDETVKLKVIQGGVDSPEIDAATLSNNIMKSTVQYYNERIATLQKDNDSLRTVIIQLQNSLEKITTEGKAKESVEKKK